MVLLLVTALLTVPTASSWCVFGPILIWLTRLNPFTCAYACLITMAYGEIILLAGSVINLVVGAHKPDMTTSTNLFNFNEILIIISDAVMALLLAGQLRALGVPIWKTLSAWVVVLNGSFVLLSILVWNAVSNVLCY